MQNNRIVNQKFILLVNDSRTQYITPYSFKIKRLSPSLERVFLMPNTHSLYPTKKKKRIVYFQTYTIRSYENISIYFTLTPPLVLVDLQELQRLLMLFLVLLCISFALLCSSLVLQPCS